MLIDRQPPPETVRLSPMPIIGALLGLLVLLLVGVRYADLDRPLPAAARSDGAASATDMPNEPVVSVTADGRVIVSHLPYALAPLPRTDGLPPATRKADRPPAVARARWPLTEIALPAAEPAPRELRAIRMAGPPAGPAETLRPLSPPAPAIEPPPTDPPAPAAPPATAP
jgi:hypothetical protein